MDALTLLLQRQSQPKLVDPAPQGEALNNILQAATRAPDHAGLRPWRFVVCSGDGLSRLGDVFQQAAVNAGKEEKDILRAAQLPHRAPMVIVAIATFKEHPKVPWVEQVASTACAIHSMQMAALAQGFNGMWRTGSYAQDGTVKDRFGLTEKDEIVGFLYLGTPAFNAPPKAPIDAKEHVTFWQ